MDQNKAAIAFVKACLTLSGKVKKDADNPFFSSNYPTLEAVLDVVLPACHAEDLMPMQTIVAIEKGIGVKTVLYHGSGDVLELDVAPIPVDKNNAQGVGSATTYGRRYSLMSIFGLAPSDDDGNAAAKAEPKKESNPENFAVLKEAAEKGLSEFRDVWKNMSKTKRETITPESMDELKKITEKKDAA